MRIDVWSDIACPWCWLGKRHLEIALEQAGIDADIAMRAYELNPIRGPTIPVLDYLLPRYGSRVRIEDAQGRLREMGARVGLHYEFSKALAAHTFDAHRVHAYAKAEGRGDAVLERFFRGYHGEGEDLAEHETLVRLAVEGGLDGSRVRNVLEGEAYADEVRRDETEARALGVTGVPFFVIDGQYGVSGAQPVEAFAQILRKIDEEAAVGTHSG